MVLVAGSMVLADIAEITMSQSLFVNRRAMAVIEFAAPMELRVPVFAQVMAETMPENTTVGSVSNHLVTVLRDGS